jgi:outer membrane protein OmpA-like peptidoglycan-associated protein
MRKIFLFLLAAFPMWLSGQSGCNFFEHRSFAIENTSLNTNQSDFGPAFVNDELWYSGFTFEEMGKLKKGESKNVFYNLFCSTIDNNGNVIGSKHFQFEPNSKSFHEGPVSYCYNTKELFVTLSNFDKPEIKNNIYRKADIRLRIIIAQKVGDNWKLKEELPFNDSTYSVAHPSISVTGDTLFFASDKPGSGFGGSDIYMSIRKEGKWGDPINLGDKINSSRDELFPFFFDGSVLFFAINKGNVQRSNLDIWYSCADGESFNDAKSFNLLNTEEDDFGLTIHPKGKVGYFASRRKGGLGDDDIYKVVIKGEYHLELLVMDKRSMRAVQNPKVKFSDNVMGFLAGGLITRDLQEDSTLLVSTELAGYQNSSKKITTVGKPYGSIRDTIWVEKVIVYNLGLLVMDKKSMQTVQNPKVKFSDNVMGVLAGGMITRELPENYTVQVSTEIAGYQNSSKNITTVGKTSETLRDTIWVEKVEIGQKFVMENIFYDYDKWDILPESEIELDKLVVIMNDNPSWKVELGSHTDAQGSDSYNEVLSQKRSDSAVNYIVNKGISNNRIIAKGYGETQLINRCKNGVVCSDEEHRQNRRTEFKILEMDVK